MAVDFHGEIVIVPTEQGIGEKTQVTSSPWRERAEEYSPDGRKIAYISDEGGEQQVWLYDIAPATRKKLTTASGEKDNLTWAPSSQKLAFGIGQQDLRSRRRRRPAARAREQSGGRLHRLAVLGRRQLAGLQPARRRAERRGVPLRHQGEEGIQRLAESVERDRTAS